jgi:hypothetical protein
MPPKGPARVGGPGRPAQGSTSYVRNAINELSSPENRSVVVAVSFFAVSTSPLRCGCAVYDELGKEEGLHWGCDSGRDRERKWD